MTRDLERAVLRARERLAEDHGSHEARADLRRAQRDLAESRREAWAEPLDLGVVWDGGAPLPHLVSSGAKAVLVCRAAVVDPDWDGSCVTAVSPTDHVPADLLVFTFSGLQAVRIGGPNDEALHEHPLHERGLDGYGPHVVHRSDWIAEQGGWQQQDHYFFVFHDEVVEVLALALDVQSVRATMAECLAGAARSVVEA